MSERIEHMFYVDSILRTISDEKCVQEKVGHETSINNKCRMYSYMENKYKIILYKYIYMTETRRIFMLSHRVLIKIWNKYLKVPNTLICSWKKKYPLTLLYTWNLYKKKKHKKVHNFMIYITFIRSCSTAAVFTDYVKNTINYLHSFV